MAEKGKCQVCSKMSEFRCSWCRLVFYCSKEHQKQDWESHKTSCTKKKYSIDQNEKLDRHFTATEDIKADQIILKDKAIFLSIKANSLEFTPNKICLGCYKEIKEDSDEDSSTSSSAESESSSTLSSRRNKICEKCELPICSPACGAQYFHKYFECRLISEALQPLADDPTESPSGSDGNEASSPLPDNNGGNKGGESSTTSPTPSLPNPASIYNRNNLGIRETVLRNLIYFRSILLKYANEKHWDEMMSLKSNEEGRTDLPNLERTTRVFAILKGILARINHPTINQVSKPDVHKILGILDINALHFNIFKEVELSALFPTFSALEHSCAPNCKFYLSPIPTTTGTGKGSSSNKKYLFELFCRSSVKIKKGENLSVSYVNLMWNTDKRREFLKKERFLWCKCPRCMDPKELGSHFSTILCPQEGCKAFSVPIVKSPENPTDIHWKCTKCGKLTPPWLVKKIDSRLCEMVGKAKPNLKSYQELLAKVEELVHPDYYLNFIVNHSLIQMFGEDEATINDKILLEEKVALSNRLLHIIKKLDPGLAKLNIYTAVIYYEMQSAILSMAGGEGDEDYKILRHKPETVKLAKVYLQKCIDCFKYEFLDVPENKLKNLALKKTEYLDFVLKFKNQKLG